MCMCVFMYNAIHKNGSLYINYRLFKLHKYGVYN